MPVGNRLWFHCVVVEQYVCYIQVTHRDSWRDYLIKVGLLRIGNISKCKKNISDSKKLSWKTVICQSRRIIFPRQRTGEAPGKGNPMWPAPHHVPPVVLTMLKLSHIHTASFIFPFNIGKIHNLTNADSTIPNLHIYIPECYCYWRSPSPVAAIKPVIYSANTIQTQIIYSVTADISCRLFNPPQGPW